MLPEALAEKVVMPIVVLAKFSNPVEPWVNPPLPDNATETVVVPLFANVAPPTSVLKVDAENVPLFVYAPPAKIAVPGITVAVEPLKVLFDPLNVWLPVFAVKVVALFTIFPLIVTDATPVSFQTLPAFNMTLPENVLLPVLASVKFPETVVVPVTPSVHVLVTPVANVVPEFILRLPPTVIAAVVVFVLLPDAVKL